MKTLRKFWKNNRSLIIFIALMSVFRSAVADWYYVPTGSMQPTIAVGDRIFTNKMAYDLRVPFTHISLLQLGDPQAGDIIVFASKKADNQLIKRVIGVPGDTVSLKGNELIINGKKLNYRDLQSTVAAGDKIEYLHGQQHTIRVAKHSLLSAQFDDITIAQNYYLVLGDNRDNSADSRVIGLIPRSEVMGKAAGVILSLDANNHYLPRKGRFFKPLI